MHIKAELKFFGLYTNAYFRRLIRFLALPHCFFNEVNWEQCKEKKLNVIKDFLYIFFILKYYPDNYSQCRLWEKRREDWKFYYGSIYDPYQRRNLRKSIQPEEYLILFEDKEICYQLCKSYDLPLPKQFRALCAEDNVEKNISSLFNDQVNHLILKPVKGKGGTGVISIEKVDESYKCYEKNNNVEISEIRIKERYLVQEFLGQHEEMNAIYPYAINTIRIETFKGKNGKIHILGTMARFGRNKSRVDNLSSGGMGVGIHINSGKLMKQAHDFNSEIHLFHPDTNIEFNNYQIPIWSKVIGLAVKIQTHFPMYSLLGHDIAITPRGPVIIEINAEPDNVMMEQCFGPILSNMEILNEFRMNNLLTNNKFK
jgi:hypothetical protein